MTATGNPPTAKGRTIVKWPAYLASIPILILLFAPGWGLSPYVAVAITALLGGLGVFLSLAALPRPLRLLLTCVGVVGAGVTAGILAAIISSRH